MDRIGPYMLLEELGSGGAGRVYRAWHTELDEVRAVKVTTDPEFVRQLRREGRVLSRLRHPRVVLVHDMNTAQEPPYVAMEYMPGGDLRHLLGKGPLPIAQAVQISFDVLDALGHAHRHGVVHRDIKPANILLDERGRAKVSDFGLGRVVEEVSLSGARSARDMSGSLVGTSSGESISGTLRYMSPEQMDPSLVADGSLDGRSDLYSFGLVLYEMLTGEFPAGAWEPPSELRPDVPAGFDEIVRTLLARRREQRYPNAAAVAGKLHDAASPRSTTYSKRKSERQVPHFAWPVLAALLLLLLGWLVFARAHSRSGPAASARAGTGSQRAGDGARAPTDASRAVRRGSQPGGGQQGRGGTRRPGSGGGAVGAVHGGGSGQRGGGVGQRGTKPGRSGVKPSGPAGAESGGGGEPGPARGTPEQGGRAGGGQESTPEPSVPLPPTPE